MNSWFSQYDSPPADVHASASAAAGSEHAVSIKMTESGRFSDAPKGKASHWRSTRSEHQQACPQFGLSHHHHQWQQLLQVTIWHQQAKRPCRLYDCGILLHYVLCGISHRLQCHMSGHAAPNALSFANSSLFTLCTKSTTLCGTHAKAVTVTSSGVCSVQVITLHCAVCVTSALSTLYSDLDQSAGHTALGTLQPAW